LYFADIEVNQHEKGYQLLKFYSTDMRDHDMERVKFDKKEIIYNIFDLFKRKLLGLVESELVFNKGTILKILREQWYPTRLSVVQTL